MTPYALRDSFASLLLHEGRGVVCAARLLGQDAGVTLSTRGAVINELDDAPRARPRMPSGPPVGADASEVWHWSGVGV